MIRKANKFDLEMCVEMMRLYASESPISLLRDPKYHDEAHIRKVFQCLILGMGIVLIDDQGRGMLAAIIDRNFWCPEIKEMKEVAWWVHPDHRDKSIGGKLWIAYQKEVQALFAKERIKIASMSLMTSSPEIDLESRGFKKIESTFSKEQSCQPA